MAREVAEGRRRVLGEQHPESATALHNFTLTLAHQARYDAAETVLLDAIRLRRASRRASGSAAIVGSGRISWVSVFECNLLGPRYEPPVPRSHAPSLLHRPGRRRARIPAAGGQ
ncbi:MAG: tetratricopeptide repeat protein [Acidobacteria bacterium]|nr:tetratricopeptide repeat protein [Acidobacteriota bacterium]